MAKRRLPAHMKALDLPYEHYVEINGGSEDCGICGKPRTPERRNHRDHDHQGDGTPRGILCPRCNRALVVRFGFRFTPEWLRAAADYLERTWPTPTQDGK